MKKLAAVLIVLALAAFAALPVAAQYPPFTHYCERPSQCPDYLDCWVSGCVNNICEYSCWW